jgi:hypothetical protein
MPLHATRLGEVIETVVMAEEIEERLQQEALLSTEQEEDEEEIDGSASTKNLYCRSSGSGRTSGGFGGSSGQ